MTFKLHLVPQVLGPNFQLMPTLQDLGTSENTPTQIISLKILE